MRHEWPSAASVVSCGQCHVWLSVWLAIILLSALKENQAGPRFFSVVGTTVLSGVRFLEGTWVRYSSARVYFFMGTWVRFCGSKSVKK